MSNFDTAVLPLLKQEGGLTHDEAGLTNHGISLRWLASVKHSASENDILEMTPEAAAALYKEFWWDRYHYQRIISQEIATKLLSLAVNLGPMPAHVCLQRAVRSATGVILHQDGILGDESFNEINKANPLELLAALKSEAAGKYRRIGNTEYLEGWLNRAYT